LKYPEESAEYQGGAVAAATPQGVESTVSVEAAVSAAILQYTYATRVPLQQTRRQHACRYDWSRSIDYHYFTLIWPICSVIHQSSSNWILPYVIPLFLVTFVAPEYVIRESRLPESLLQDARD
jgi:hypothetical protein